MTNTEHSIANVLKDCFGISATVAPVGKGQAQTELFQIDCKGTRWLAKLHGSYFETRRSYIEYECAMLEFLASRDLPVAPNVRTVSGLPFAIVDSRPFVVYQWSEGCVEWPTTQVKSELLGAALARMHLALDDFSSTIDAPVYDSKGLVETPLQLLRPFAESKEQFDTLFAAVQKVLRLISSIPIEPATFGPIHGDIHQGNCHFTSETEVTVFDFSLAGRGYRTYDLTGFLWPMRDQTIEDPAMQIACQGFLSGYEQVRPLTTEERDAIPAFVQIRSLWETGNWIEAGTGREQPEDVAKSLPYLIKQFSTVSI